jgi:steroid 5-alpha reductase family enzyme
MILKNNSIVDFAWGLGFLLVALYNFIMKEQIYIQDVIFLVLIAVWALRLAIHIFIRNYKKPEDFRYLKWRREWGKYFVIRSFFQIFMLQGVLLFIVSLPIIVGFSGNSKTAGWLFIPGILIFLTGLLFEAIADKQLADFKKDPSNKGKIITSGLWRYSRHPNYFGEFILWVGIFVMSLGMNMDPITVVSPILMFILLNYVSGVPLLEKKYANRADFEEYKKKTSVFFPWFPK